MSEECDRLLEKLDHYLHGELDQQQAHHLQAHLEECPPCLEGADFQAQLKALVAKRCGETVPDGLQERVLGFLRAADPS